MLVVLVLVLASPLVLLMALTALGERRRGGRALTVVAAGMFFPVAWTVWYARDQRPFARGATARA